MTAMTDRVVLLGTKGGPAIRKGGPNPTSSLLIMDGHPIVVDCGLGVTRALVEAGLPLTQLRTIILTHLHSDHVLELGPLLHTAWTSGLASPVTVYGPSGSAALWDGFCSSLAFDINLRIRDEGRPDLRDLIRMVDYSEGPLDIPGLEVTALRVVHPPVTDCFALRFDTPGWRVVVSADTTHFPPLAELAQGADILVHEAMLGAGIDALCARVGNADDRLRQHLLASHTLLEDAIAIGRAANVGHLMLHHLVPCDLPGFDVTAWRQAAQGLWPGGKVTIGTDGFCALRAAG